MTAVIIVYIKDHNQTEIFDPWSFLSPKRRCLLAQSWARLFKDEILCVLIFQQTHDLNDEEAVSQLAFNIQWHYVLNISEESDSDKYMCPKTLWDMRSIVADNGLDTKLSMMYYISVSG